MTSFFASVTGALIGVTGALAVGFLIRRRTERREATTRIVHEFFSDDFLRHRISVARTQCRVEDADVSISDIAPGFWYPGYPDYYRGEVTCGLNEHQHIEAFIGFMIRLAYLVSTGGVFREELNAVLGMKLVWNVMLLDRLAEETRRQAVQASRQIPSWVSSIEIVVERLMGMESSIGDL